MFGIERVERELIETNALLDHISGQLEGIARLLRMLVERDDIVFEPDEEAFEETLTA